MNDTTLGYIILGVAAAIYLASIGYKSYLKANKRYNASGGWGDILSYVGGAAIILLLFSGNLILLLAVPVIIFLIALYHKKYLGWGHAIAISAMMILGASIAVVARIGMLLFRICASFAFGGGQATSSSKKKYYRDKTRYYGNDDETLNRAAVSIGADMEYDNAVAREQAESIKQALK